MKKFTVNALRRAAMKAFSKKEVQAQLYNIVHEKFVEKKSKLINDFENHPVSKEIKNGETASNSSGTLIGGNGNLFSFLGFFQGTDPVGEVSNYLEKNVKMMKRPEISIKGNATYYEFEIRYPDKEELKSVSPMEWETGRSWLFGIEKGVSGLSHYLYHKYYPPHVSNSTTAIQSKYRVIKKEGVTFKRTSYISLMLSNFKKGWGRL